MYSKYTWERRQKEAEFRAQVEERERRAKQRSLASREELAARFRTRVEEWLHDPGEVEAVRSEPLIWEHQPRDVAYGNYFGPRRYVPDTRRVQELEATGSPYLKQPPYTSARYPFRERVKSLEGPLWRYRNRTESERLNETIGSNVLNASDRWPGNSPPSFRGSASLGSGSGSRTSSGGSPGSLSGTGKASGFVVRRVATAGTAGAFLGLQEPYAERADPRNPELGAVRQRFKRPQPPAPPFFSTFPADGPLPPLPQAGISPRKEYFNDARAIANRTIDAGDLTVGMLPAEEKVSLSKKIITVRYH